MQPGSCGALSSAHLHAQAGPQRKQRYPAESDCQHECFRSVGSLQPRSFWAPSRAHEHTQAGTQRKQCHPVLSNCQHMSPDLLGACSQEAVEHRAGPTCTPRQAQRASLSLQLMERVGSPLPGLRRMLPTGRSLSQVPAHAPSAGCHSGLTAASAASNARRSDLLPVAGMATTRMEA